MSQAILSVRMDENIKRMFDAFCADAGMNASAVINLFVNTTVREKKIPFEIIANDDPFYSEKNLARLKSSMEQLEAGLGVAHELIEVEDDV